VFVAESVRVALPFLVSAVVPTAPPLDITPPREVLPVPSIVRVRAVILSAPVIVLLIVRLLVELLIQIWLAPRENLADEPKFTAPELLFIWMPMPAIPLSEIIPLEAPVPSEPNVTPPVLFEPKSNSPMLMLTLTHGELV